MLLVFRRAAGALVRSLIIAVIGTAGLVIGAVGGLLSGIANENGMLLGTLMGAITAGLLSVQLAESFLMICFCDDYSVEARIRQLRLEIRNLTAARLLSGSVFASISSALDSQIDAFQHDSGAGERGGDLFEPSYPVMATRRPTVDRLPVTEITNETTGQQTTCPICLHEFQAGEYARILPACSHVFHLECIDSWLIWKPECPMCRHTVY
ncbi:hypothetical protein ACQJBY_004590 [Aegilops geniculata]